LSIGLCRFLENSGLERPPLDVTTFHVRRLPHFHSVGQPTFLTWRLHGSLPPGRAFPPATTHGRAFVAMDRVLDVTRTAPLHLYRPEIAKMIVETLQYHAQHLEHYHLHSYVVMPDHVHLSITPRAPVSKLMQSLKRFTAWSGNRIILGLTGQPFWQDESYDRLVRDEGEFQRIVRYIETNPVNGGLVATPEEFPWSSARPIDNRPQVDMTTCPTSKCSAVYRLR
jgi:putative DNA methylase